MMNSVTGEQMRILISEQQISAVLEHAKEESPKECVGLLLKSGEYIRFKNVSPTPMTHFALDIGYIEYEGQIQAICHSHVGRSATPSEHDKVSCKASGVPWLIVGVPNGDWQILLPENVPAPVLMGREYVSGVQDCLVFVLDALAEFHQLTFPDGAFPRDAHQDWRKMIEYAKSQDFRVIDPDDCEPVSGDIILMFVKGRGHLGLMSEDGYFLHHDLNRLSEKSIYGGFWKKHTVALLRHKRFEK
jgi:proteasome lid subunit RPN8/RPN11